MNKFDSICSRIQEAIGGTPNPIINQGNKQNQNNLDLDALSNTLAKTSDPAAIKKALSPLIGTNTQQPHQPSISMTGTSGPTTSTTNQAGQRAQAPTTNTGAQPTNTGAQPQSQPTTNTQAAKQSLSDDEVDKILNNVQIDQLLKSIQKRTNYKHEG
jgi:hypothetical protein